MNRLGYFNGKQDAFLVTEVSVFTSEPQRDHRIGCYIDQASRRAVVLKNRQALELGNFRVSAETTVCCPSEKVRLDLSEARLVWGSVVLMSDAVEEW